MQLIARGAFGGALARCLGSSGRREHDSLPHRFLTRYCNQPLQRGTPGRIESYASASAGAYIVLHSRTHSRGPGHSPTRAELAILTCFLPAAPQPTNERPLTADDAISAASRPSLNSLAVRCHNAFTRKGFISCVSSRGISMRRSLPRRPSLLPRLPGAHDPAPCPAHSHLFAASACPPLL